MKNPIATAGPITAWAKANNSKITMWHRGTSWYIGLRQAGQNTILHCGQEKYIRGVWRDRYANRGW